MTRLDQSEKPNSVRRLRLDYRNYFVSAWRFACIGLLAFWQGGFTFYGAVVIPMAHRVLGTHLAVGFITQRVANWLNLIGAISLSLLLGNLPVVRRKIEKRLWWSLVVSWCVMAMTMIALVAMHPMLDRLLDGQTHEIIDGTRFRPLHKIYLNIATLQWVGGLIHLWCLLLIPAIGHEAIKRRREMRCP